jgi:hypothetical protein
MEFEAMNFYGRNIRLYLRIGIIAVKFGIILDRKSLPPSRFVVKSDETPFKGPYSTLGIPAV